MDCTDGEAIALPIRELVVDPGQITSYNRIGLGAQGDVYKINVEGRWRAIKTIAKEVDVLHKLRHPNIVELIGIARLPNGPAIVMEYIEKNLKEHIDQVKRLGKDQFVKIAKDVATGITHMHNMQIVHRDVKTVNILVMENSSTEVVAKICDFGSAVASSRTLVAGTFTMAGTLEYMAPENGNMNGVELEGLGENDMKVEKSEIVSRVDTWSFGCVLWEMVTSMRPYNDCDPATLLSLVATGQLRLPVPPEASFASLSSLFDKCLAINPQRRISMKDVVSVLEKLEEELKTVTEASWLREQQMYFNFKKEDRFQTHKARTSVLQLHRDVGDTLQKCWNVLVAPALKNMLRRLFSLFWSKNDAEFIIISLSDKLFRLGKTEGYRRIATFCERSITYVLTNISVLLRDGPNSIHFIPFRKRGVEYHCPNFWKPASDSQLFNGLEHPNIAKQITSPIVNEDVGRNLRQFIGDSERLKKDEFLQIAKGVAQGLSYLHENGIVHRDIKTESILVRKTSSNDIIAKIRDFGTARLSPQGRRQMTAVGTWEFVAPEITGPKKFEMYGLDGAAQDKRKMDKVAMANRVDTWSFGCVLWEMVTSHFPFHGCDRLSIPGLVAREDLHLPIPPGASVEALSIVIGKCVAIRPEDRSSMQSVVELIENVEEELCNLDDEEWAEEQLKYVGYLQEHGFHTVNVQTRLLNLRGEVYDVLEMLWNEAWMPISKNILNSLLQLHYDEKLAERISRSLFEKLNVLFAPNSTIARSISYVITNTAVLLTDGPDSVHFVRYLEDDRNNNDDPEYCIIP